MDRLSGAGLGHGRKLQIWLMRESVNSAKFARQRAGVKLGHLGEIAALTELRPMLSSGDSGARSMSTTALARLNALSHRR